MKMRLRLPAIQGFSILNVFPAAYTQYFHLVSLISGFIIINVFYQKIHLSIKTGLLFSFRLEPQYTSETFVRITPVIHVFKLKV
jgi:hypothetical protein